jgi:predicted O-methyltransferase YrrM
MITWISDNEIEIDGTKFKLAFVPEHGVLTVMKERFHIEAYAELAKEIKPGSNIVEIGIRSGASTALMAVLYKPRCLSAIEINKKSTKLFTHFLESHPDGRRIRTHFGCDQGDVNQLGAVLDADFAQQALDLVIDDASHQLIPSMASFNLLFPRLRPGGVFVIEDWSWEHYAERELGLDFTDWDVTGFAKLALMTVLACAHSPDIIEKVTLRRGIAVVHRGPGALKPGEFKLDNLLGERGKELLSDAGQKDVN